jgi:RNA polymerase sigma factor (sigma-70 family)
MTGMLNNEKELLQHVAGGDQKAFQVIFDHYWDSMLANTIYITKSVFQAEDLTQEIFIKVWMNREKLLEVQRFDAYLYKLAKHLIVDTLRKRILPVIPAPVFDIYFEDEALTPQGLMELSELDRLINEAIARLPAQMQTAFKLSRYEGLSHEQIAGQMNISRNSSQTYVARALVQIRAYLGKNGPHLGIVVVALAFIKK